MSYHPLHSTGTITMLDIIREKGHCDVSAEPSLSWKYTLRDIALGYDGVPLNRNPSVNSADLIARIEKTGVWAGTAYKISDWYGYNQIGGDTYTTETEYLGTYSNERYLYQLRNSKKDTILFADLTGLFGRICDRQKETLRKARKNVLSADYETEPSDVNTLSVSVSHDNKMKSLLSASTECTIERGIIKVAMTDLTTYTLDDGRTINSVQIRLNGIAGEVGTTLVLVAYRPTTTPGYVTTYDWWGGENAGLFDIDRPEYCLDEVSDEVEYADGELVFTLNTKGLSYFLGHKDVYEFIYFEIMLKQYDHDGDIHYGDNLISGNDASFDGVNNWQKLEEYIIDGSYTIYNGNYQGRTGVERLSYYDLTGARGLGITLSKSYINGWESLLSYPTYQDNGFNTNMYTVKLDYIWGPQPSEYVLAPSVFTGFKSHLHINGEHIGCADLIGEGGIFNSTLRENFEWKTAVTSEDITAVGSSQNNNGIAIYIVYELLSRADGYYELYLDNIGLYKSFYYKKVWTSFQFTTTPTIEVTWNVKDLVPTMDTIPAYNIQPTSVTVGTEYLVSYSSLTNKGIIIKAGSVPTIGDYDFIRTTTSIHNIYNEQDFSLTVSGLSSGTLYYARPFATNWAGTGYGSTTIFTTT